MTQDSIRIRKGTTYVFPESACMLATDASGAIIVVEQFRKPRAEQTLELPGGAVDAGETPCAAAVREFAEETGLRAVDSKFLFTLDLDLSTTLHRTHVFTSQVLEASDAKNAEFPIRRMPVNEALSAVRSGSITHAPTVAATLAIALQFEREGAMWKM